ncbi:unnamed protein product [Ambrosiozyma monospora]|uniref:Unnamed protein product n=1 Tax=Ambrosiozyma monospora TaxID=43982 RepID=A0ACB5SWV6_AMBMO|nr:unnamed protein product [Ambrosiozyma monospora]
MNLKMMPMSSPTKPVPGTIHSSSVLPMQLHLRLRNQQTQTQQTNDTHQVFRRSETKDNRIILNSNDTPFSFSSISTPDGSTEEANEFFNTTCKKMMDDKLFKGTDCLLFTLGPSNSGKTHAIFGSESHGLVYQAVDEVFKHVKGKSMSTDFKHMSERLTGLREPSSTSNTMSPSDNCSKSPSSSPSGVKYAITISMFEIYNDFTRDLLTTPVTECNKNIVTDQKDNKLRPFELTQTLVKDRATAKELIMKGATTRATASTFINGDSSRSHCFVFINIIKIFKGFLTSSRLTIADLAGLERSKLSMTTGINLKESCHTNISLTELGRCLELIVTKQFDVSLLRTNKLTRLLLHDFAKKKCPVCVLVTLDPFGEESLINQTLKYINPVQYQKIKRRSLNFERSRVRSRSPSVHLLPNDMMNQVEEMKARESMLKKKVLDLEEAIVTTEKDVRTEMYKSNEKQIGELKAKYSQEKFKMKSDLIQSSDSKVEELYRLYKTQISTLKESLDDKVTESAKLSGELLSEKQRAADLENSLQLTKKEFKLASAMSDTKIEDLTISLNETKSVVESIQNQLHLSKKKHKEVISSKDKTIEKLTAQNEKLMEQLIILKDVQLLEHNKLAFEKKQLEENLQSETKKLQTELKLKDEHNEQLEKLASENKKWHDELNAKCEEYSKLETLHLTSVSDNEKVVCDMTAQLKSLNEKILQLECENASADELKTKNESLQSSVKEMQIKLETIENEKFELDVNQRVNEHTHKGLKSQLQSNDILIYDSITKLDDITAKHNGPKEKLESEESKTSLLVSRLDTANAEIENLKQQVIDKDASISKMGELEKTHDVFKEKFESEESKTALLVSQLETVTAVIKTLKQQAADKDASISKMGELEKTHDVLKEQLQSEESEAGLLASQLETATAEIETLKQQIAKKDASNSKVIELEVQLEKQKLANAMMKDVSSNDSPAGEKDKQIAHLQSTITMIKSRKWKCMLRC